MESDQIMEKITRHVCLAQEWLDSFSVIYSTLGDIKKKKKMITKETENKKKLICIKEYLTGAHNIKKKKKQPKKKTTTTTKGDWELAIVITFLHGTQQTAWIWGW